MTRSLKPVLIAALALAVPVAQASAATTKKVVYPSVSKVSPLKIAIGDTMTITGKNFRSGKNHNTVVFQRTGSPAVFVPAVKATTTKLTVVLPSKLAPFLATKTGAAVPTTFRLRILSARFSKSFTSPKLSPEVAPKATSKTSTGTGAAPAAPPAPTCQALAALDPAGDKDADGISNAREAQIGTDPCNPDSDGDGMVDGYEYQSALDLNGAALPYPGSRPWPNALDPSDGGHDFDGDGLTLSEEYALWKYVGGTFPVTQYSDGTQNSGGRVYVQSTADQQLDLNGNGILTDDERDADGDGLSNMVEDNMEGTQAWWKAAYNNEQPYSISAFSDLSATNPDVDGDGVPDGLDDQDHDGWSNVQEMQYTRAESGYRVEPFNPCLPDPYSRTCGRYIPFSNPWPPFDNTQHVGDMVPFRNLNVPGSNPSNSWNGTGGPQD